MAAFYFEISNLNYLSVLLRLPRLTGWFSLLRLPDFPAFPDYPLCLPDISRRDRHIAGRSEMQRLVGARQA